VSDTYTKLFSSITESTVWGEAYATRIVWVTMLAMADAQGDVYGAVPGLARRANVTLPEVEAALAAFLTPDPYSRTKDDDGRRIEEIEGGWHLINHGKYSAIRGTDERREYKRQWDRENRPSGHARSVRQQSDNSPTKPDSPAPPALTPTPDLKEQEQKSSARQAERFADFWAVYPKKVKRKDAEALWTRRKFDAIADALIADVLNRAANDDGWQRGYVPDPTTYLNQERWNDEVRAAPTARAGPAAPAPSRALLAMQKIQGVKRGLAGNRADERTNEAGVPRLGVDTEL
jgi:hypothetical protein